MNVLDYTYYFSITDLLLENNIPQLLLSYNEILSKGFDGHHFIMGLASHFRDLLVCKNEDTVELLEVGETVKTMYLQQSSKSSSEFLVEAIDLANSCDLKYKSSRNPRLLVELCLMQLGSITQKAEKKKSDGRRFVIPPSFFKDVATKQQPKVENTPAVNNNTDDSGNIREEDKIPETVLPAPEESEIVRERVIERPQILAERNAKKVSALSLKSIQKKQQLKKELIANQPDEDNLPVTDFSEKEMQTAWDDYARKVENDGKYNLLSHLTMGTPKLEGSLIHLVFPNDTIRVEVERAKFELLGFLRDKLQNYEIDLSIEVNEAETKRYAYTAREKFEKLKEKNPLIDKLRQEFDLEI